MIKREDLEAGQVDLSRVAAGGRLPSIHPGEILNEEFLAPLGVSQYRLAKGIGVSPRRVNEIVHGGRGITADTALRLGKYFGMSPAFWMNLQTAYDLEQARANINIDEVETMEAAA